MGAAAAGERGAGVRAEPEPATTSKPASVRCLFPALQTEQVAGHISNNYAAADCGACAIAHWLAAAAAAAGKREAPPAGASRCRTTSRTTATRWAG